MRAHQNQVTAVIANGGTVSSAVCISDHLPVALQMPAAFTGTAVSFTGSFDGSTFQPVYVGGSLYTELVAAGENVVLDPSMFYGFRQIQVVSNATEGQQDSIVVMLRTDG